MLLLSLFFYIIVIIIVIFITGKKELARYFNSYLFHSLVPDIQEHYFETTSVRTPIFEQLYRKTVTRSLDMYNFNFKYTKKIQVEKRLHNITTRKACGHGIIIPQLLKDLRYLVHYHC